MRLNEEKSDIWIASVEELLLDDEDPLLDDPVLDDPEDSLLEELLAIWVRAEAIV